jgi:hypothetical protein
MPTYICVGHHSGNKGLLTSKGYFIKRLGKVLYRRWGSIKIQGRNQKKISWEVGYPQDNKLVCKSIPDAKEKMRLLIQRRQSNGYHKIIDVIK